VQKLRSPGGGPVIAVVRLGGGRVLGMAKELRLPTHTTRFPGRCVNCGATAETTVPIECVTGVDMILIKVWRWHEFEIPCCADCKTRRRTLGVLFTIASIQSVIACLLGMLTLEPYFAAHGLRDTWLLLTLGVFLATVYFARNWLRPILDAWLMGVSGVRLDKDGFAVLRFRDAVFAAETEKIRWDDA